MIGAPTESRSSRSASRRRSSRTKDVSINASRKTLKRVPLNNVKEFSREAKEAAQAAVKNAWVALKEEHEIMNIVYKNQAQFPRSERVLMVSAALLGQLWVTGLFQSSGLLQAQWACAATSSGKLQWGALNSTDW